MQRYFSRLASPTLPTLVALRRMLSRVPTRIALRRLHLCSFRFRHTRFGLGHGGGWMTFCKGNPPLTRLPKKARKIATQKTHRLGAGDMVGKVAT